ncbi:SURF1 family protein [Bordetella sp. LUAb4]|uniref:SURF1 family protein n=1 Tax=Bordetella sp. LUAb4 TaxID=2843195 RepID=UPI001E5908BE|nr:SURF1 family protein [Bordetella sp. LUAb4]
MVRPHSTVRTLAALLLLALAVVVLASLGRWQLHRADERRAILAAIEGGRAQAPLTLAADTPAGQLQAWRPVQAYGRYRDDLTVVLDNRNRDGRPGYWIATPLLLEERGASASMPGSRSAGGGAQGNAAQGDPARGNPVQSSAAPTAILVLRGWMPRAAPGQPAAIAPPAPTDPRHVTGELAERVPRLFELWHFGGAAVDVLPSRLPQADGKPPTVQNLDLTAYAAATGLRLLPAVLEQRDARTEALPRDERGREGAALPRDADPSRLDAATSPRDADVLKQDWPQPSVDFNQNQGYALQWFGFATIAGIAFLVVAWRALRRRRER